MSAFLNFLLVVLKSCANFSINRLSHIYLSNSNDVCFSVAHEPEVYQICTEFANEAGTHFLDACSSGDFSAVQLNDLIQSNPRYREILEFTGPNGEKFNLAPLMLVLTSLSTDKDTKFEKALVLLEAGADSNHSGLSDDSSPLGFAIAANLTKCAELLLLFQANSTYMDGTAFTPLLLAFHSKDIDSIKMILALDVDQSHPLRLKAEFEASHNCSYASCSFAAPLPVDYKFFQESVAKNLHLQQTLLEGLPNNRKLEVAYEMGFLKFLLKFPVSKDNSVVLRCQSLRLLVASLSSDEGIISFRKLFITAVSESNISFLRALAFSQEDSYQYFMQALARTYIAHLPEYHQAYDHQVLPSFVACASGQLSVLQEFFPSTLINRFEREICLEWAVRFGKLDLVVHLTAGKRHFNGSIMEKAFENGHLQIIKYFQSIGIPITSHSINKAIINGHLEVIRHFLPVIRFQFSETMVSLATTYNQLEIRSLIQSAL